MNPRLVFHLFLTDARRLRWILVVAWAVMLVAALPALRFDTADFAPFYEMRMGGGGANEEERAALHEFLYVGIPTASGGYAKIVLPLLLLGISASLGFHGAGWAQVRPLRLREKVAAALLSLLAFIVLPQCAIIGLNLGIHGFSAAEIANGVLRAGTALLVLHACSAVFGRICGSLLRWLAGIAGVSVIAGLAALFPGRYGNRAFLPGWWGERSEDCLPLLLVLAGLLLLVFLFRGGRRPKLRMALVLLVMVTVPSLVQTWRPSTGWRVLQGLPRHPQADVIRPELVPGSFYQERYSPPRKHSTLMVQAGTRGLPADEGMIWMLEKAGPLFHQGKAIDQYGNGPDDLLRRGMNILPAWLPMPIDYVAKLPFETSERHVSPSTSERLWLGSFDLSGMPSPDAPLSLDAEVLGVGCRYRVIFNEPLQDKMTIRAGDIRGHARLVRSGVLAPTVDLLCLRPSQNPGTNFYREDDFLRFLCFLHLPESGRYVDCRHLLEATGPLLSQGKIVRRVMKFDGVTGQELTSARLVLVMPEITGSVRARVTADGLRLPADQPQGQRDISHFLGRSYEDAFAYPADRPSPLTCTEDQAGHWIMLNASQRGDTAGRELAPYVRRFPQIFLNYRAWRTPMDGDAVPEALYQALPDGQRQLLIDKVTHKDPQAESHLLSVMNRRGWQDPNPDQLLKALVEKPSLELIAAVAAREDPATYPQLLAAMDRLRSIRAYRLLRRLPGIEDLLSETITAAFARDRTEILAGLGSNVQSPKLALPAAHGMQEAFELLYAAEKDSHDGHEEALYNLAWLTTFPPGNQGWQQCLKYLRAREAKDYRYDAFTAYWIPLSDTP
jgi:hypothetical protein